MRTAEDLAAANDGEVHVTSVVTLPERTPLSEGYQYVDERRAVLGRAMENARERDLPVSGSVRIGHHAADAIVERTADHDLTIIGATREGLLQEYVFGAVPVAVAERTRNAVIVSGRNLGVTSSLRRWLRWG